MGALLQILSYGVFSGALYGLVALGLSLVFGVMNYLNVAHGALIMLASYTVLWVCYYLHFDPFLSLILVVPTFFVIGWVLFLGLFQRLLALPETEKIKNSLLISFGILLICSNGATMLWTADERAVATSYTGKVLDLLGVRRKEREIDPGTIPGGALRIRLSWPYSHTLLPALNGTLSLRYLPHM